MVLAIIEERDDHLSIFRRQAAEQVMRIIVLAQEGGHLLRRSQIGASRGKQGIGLIIEIAQDTIPRPILGGQFMIQFQVIIRTPHQHHETKVPAVRAVSLNGHAHGQPENGHAKHDSQQVGQEKPGKDLHITAQTQDGSSQQGKQDHILRHPRQDLISEHLPLEQHHPRVHRAQRVTQHQGYAHLKQGRVDLLCPRCPLRQTIKQVKQASRDAGISQDHESVDPIIV